MTYDGTNDLLLSSQTEAQDYYDYLLNTVFSGDPEFRTVTLIYSNVSVLNWKTRYRSALMSFLDQIGVPYSDPDPKSMNRLGVSGVMVVIAFGK